MIFPPGITSSCASVFFMLANSAYMWWTCAFVLWVDIKSSSSAMAPSRSPLRNFSIGPWSTLSSLISSPLFCGHPYSFWNLCGIIGLLQSGLSIHWVSQIGCVAGAFHWEGSPLISSLWCRRMRILGLVNRSYGFFGRWWMQTFAWTDSL